MRLPNVLIIGAMKAGTTSLYMDLAHHPQGYLANDKEPHALCRDAVLTDEGRAAYAALYEKAAAGAILCDASTGYSKRPDFEGVAERAAATLPSGFQVIYLVRHPIERIISQHHHEYFDGQAEQSIDEAVRRHDRYVAYSRYAYQLEPWIKAVGLARIQVIRFEDYVDRRSEALEAVWRFLNVPPHETAAEEGTVYNKSQGKPVKSRFWKAVRQNRGYRTLLRPLAPLKLRLALQRWILPPAEEKLAPPSASTRLYLYDALRDDVRRLGEMLGRSAPMWEDFLAERLAEHRVR